MRVELVREVSLPELWLEIPGTKLCMGVGILYKIMEQELWVVNTCRCERGVLRACGSSAPLSTYLALCTSSIWLVLSYILS